jgi:hypothetical protein
VIDASLYDSTISDELSVNSEAPGRCAKYVSELSLALTSWSWMHSAGREREGRRTVLLLSMTFTHDIIGLAAGFL